MLNDDVQTRLVTVTEAATIMQCSVETVRRRLRSGTLTGRRDVNGTGREVWSVAVPATMTIPSEPAPEHARSASPDASDATVLRALIDDLRDHMRDQAQAHAGEVARLGAMLNDRRREVDDLHRIVERMSAPMLPPPTTGTPAPRSWWRFW
jgi:hypothetical protein